MLTVYGIETLSTWLRDSTFSCSVATVLTVYGIETMEIAEDVFSENGVGLQQCLPFTVLKLN